jgi:L-ascorbate metabolism protein UlaG (beta-lactamase superfamily)
VNASLIAAVTLVWHGQAAFTVTSPGGTKVLMDPLPKDLGYPMPPAVEADAVTISHEHFDHTNAALAKGTPPVLRGLTPDKKGWEKHDRTVKDTRIRSVGVWHDEKQGAVRGLNAVFILEMPGLKLAHLGDLGHLLTDEQLKAIGPVDAVLIPVGGVYTIDGAQARRVVEQLKPKWVVVPMHYKTSFLKIDLQSEKPFLEGLKNVRHAGGSTLTVDEKKPPAAAEVVVLEVK